ncbi:MAG: hypothetical protein ACI9BF_000220 [Candidatus Paceibacteria bacterium]|jgi:hypothetical protein
MFFLSIVHHYLIWHYSRGLLEIFHVWLNLLWFVVYFFSLPQLMNSWFSPWKRIVEKRKMNWNLEDIAGVIIVGIISRIIGFTLRTVIIFIGLVCLFITILGGLATYVFWVAAPLIIISLLGFGITLLIA